MPGKVTPCLWFDQNAEDAVSFYVEQIPNSRITSVSHYGDGAPLPAGTAMMIEFELDGRDMSAINGGPMFQLTPAISMMVACDNQAEIDRLWESLSEGGEKQACGWVLDRFGLSWQIIPSILPELMGGDADRSARVMQALWGMTKLEIQPLLDAADG